MRRLLALALVLCSSTGYAQSDFQTGPYVGFGLGQLDYESLTVGFQFEDTSIYQRVYGGTRFSETFAFEISYAMTDDLNWAGTGEQNPYGRYSTRIDGEHDIFSARFLAYAGKVFFGAGVFKSNFDTRTYGTFPDLISNPDFDILTADSDSGLTYLFGGEWPFDAWSLRLEFEYVDTEASVNAWNMGVGGHYKWK